MVESGNRNCINTETVFIWHHLETEAAPHPGMAAQQLQLLFEQHAATMARPGSREAMVTAEEWLRNAKTEPWAWEVGLAVLTSPLQPVAADDSVRFLAANFLDPRQVAMLPSDRRSQVIALILGQISATRPDPADPAAAAPLSSPSRRRLCLAVASALFVSSASEPGLLRGVLGTPEFWSTGFAAMCNIVGLVIEEEAAGGGGTSTAAAQAIKAGGSAAAAAADRSAGEVAAILPLAHELVASCVAASAASPPPLSISWAPAGFDAGGQGGAAAAAGGGGGGMALLLRSAQPEAFRCLAAICSSRLTSAPQVACWSEEALARALVQAAQNDGRGTGGGAAAPAGASSKEEQDLARSGKEAMLALGALLERGTESVRLQPGRAQPVQLAAPLGMLVSSALLSGLLDPLRRLGGAEEYDDLFHRVSLVLGSAASAYPALALLELSSASCPMAESALLFSSHRANNVAANAVRYWSAVHDALENLDACQDPQEQQQQPAARGAAARSFSRLLEMQIGRSALPEDGAGSDPDEMDEQQRHRRETAQVNIQLAVDVVGLPVALPLLVGAACAGDGGGGQMAPWRHTEACLYALSCLTDTLAKWLGAGLAKYSSRGGGFGSPGRGRGRDADGLGSVSASRSRSRARERIFNTICDTSCTALAVRPYE